ncbi:hypothetical protein [Citrobacter portucalensis]|uniref:hypothetical protein n=1 Tax=Citrobacter portucalensis TaxID=1639133 RepID=UPI00397B856A
MTVYEMEGFLRGKCLPGDMKVNETNAQYLVRKFSEFESNLSESKREFRAADATINNLELKLTDMAVQLANAESKCRELAAENTNKSRCLGFFASVIKSGEEWTSACEHEYSEAFKTPATDAFLAEVRAQGVDALAQTLEGLVAVSVTRSYIMEFAAQLRKGVQS